MTRPILVPDAPPVADSLAVQLTRLEIEALRGLTIREALLKKEAQAFQTARAEIISGLLEEWGAPVGSDINLDLESGTAQVTFPKPKVLDA